jgi:hypothetical protein
MIRLIETVSEHPFASAGIAVFTVIVLDMIIVNIFNTIRNWMIGKFGE